MPVLSAFKVVCLVPACSVPWCLPCRVPGPFGGDLDGRRQATAPVFWVPEWFASGMGRGFPPTGRVRGLGTLRLVAKPNSVPVRCHVHELDRNALYHNPLLQSFSSFELCTLVRARNGSL